MTGRSSPTFAVKPFNRTIVELKYFFSFQIHVNSCSFYSYHSGIEIEFETIDKIIHQLLIVP